MQPKININLKIKSFNSHADLLDACETCINYDLYHPGWTMFEWYSKHLDGWNIFSSIHIAYIDNIPVGVLGVVLDSYAGYYNCGTYVIPEFRRKGIGSGLINHALKQGIELSASNCYNVSISFYKKALYDNPRYIS